MERGHRVADDDVYLNETYFENPKEIHKFVGNLVAEEGRSAPCHLLDVGCAIGERIHYMQQRFPTFAYTGMDVSTAMIERAGALNPRADFRLGSVLDPGAIPERAYDIVICGGVLAIFDDIAGPIHNLVSRAREGGSVYLSDTFNNDPIDVIMRYRRVSEEGGGDWEIGWNVFSKITVERLLRATGRVGALSWHDFRLPFDLPKRADVMRTWTLRTENNPHQIVNGAAQILDVSVVRAEIRG